MKLQDILQQANLEFNNLSTTTLNTNITNIVTNSKKVNNNSIFIARKGYKSDGHAFIPEALKRGALVIIAEQYNLLLTAELTKNNKLILVKNTKEIIGKLCKIFYKNLPEYIFAVTGTNGKTSTSTFVSQILTANHINSATIGTLGVFCNGVKCDEIDSTLTTPDVDDLFRILSYLKNQKQVNHVILEASSEGIAEGRLNDLAINASIFTNLTQDHLNYHTTMEKYYAVKSSLFTEIMHENGIAIINSDDDYGKKLIQQCASYHKTVVDYGLQAKTLQLISYKFVNTGYELTIKYNNHEYPVRVNLLGDFHIYNILAGMLLLIITKQLNLSQIINSIPKLHAAKGRMELICSYNQANVFVDYAHTPNALEEVLQTLKKVTNNKLIVVFGCGGNRDKGKRPLMGKVAMQFADIVYITDDNPRDENPSDIRQEIILGLQGSNNLKYYEVADRKQAIYLAMQNLSTGDTLLVAGKGHEEVQIINNVTIPFSDSDIILKFSLLTNPKE